MKPKNPDATDIEEIEGLSNSIVALVARFSRRIARANETPDHRAVCASAFELRKALNSVLGFEEGVAQSKLEEPSEENPASVLEALTKYFCTNFPNVMDIEKDSDQWHLELQEDALAVKRLVQMIKNGHLGKTKFTASRLKKHFLQVFFQEGAFNQINSVSSPLLSQRLSIILGFVFLFLCVRINKAEMQGMEKFFPNTPIAGNTIKASCRAFIMDGLFFNQTGRLPVEIFPDLEGVFAQRGPGEAFGEKILSVLGGRKGFGLESPKGNHAKLWAYIQALGKRLFPEIVL